MVFQNYALFPHMTVYENVAYGLRARHAARELIRERVARMLATVQLEALAERMPRQLSGGQQQRVALARALAVEPRILLLDEPFGALDKNLRLDMQIEVKRLQRQFGITAILVTHDQEEAMSLADRIAVMHRGRVEQFASPVEVYDRPRTLFVNSFVGTANLLAGRDRLPRGRRRARWRSRPASRWSCPRGPRASASSCRRGPRTCACIPRPGPGAGPSSCASACRSAPRP